MHIKEEFRHEVVIKKSQFIAIIKTVTTEEDARIFIEEIRKEFRDSSHVCTAYIIGEHDEIQRSSDNGEPAGTAGVPMLEVLKKSGLSDICACVVRYFGGIKLGAGGLIRAYSGSLSEAISLAPKTETKQRYIYEVCYPYDMQGSLETWLRRNATIVDTMYDENVTVLVQSDDDSLIAQIKDLTHGQILAKFLRIDPVEVDILT